MPFELLTFAELLATSFRSHPSNKPTDPRQPYGEWYCGNANCAVRGVKINAKFVEPDDKLPKIMHCPACSSVLDFHHWIRIETVKPNAQ